MFFRDPDGLEAEVCVPNPDAEPGVMNATRHPGRPLRARGRLTGGVSGYVRAADEGDAYDWHGARVVVKASGADTFGQLAVMDSTYPPGLSVPAHAHAGEDEMFYVLDGELSGFCDDDRWTAAAGSFVFVPRDRPHGFVVTSAGPARALVIVGPPRLDGQVAATGTPVDRA